MTRLMTAKIRRMSKRRRKVALRKRALSIVWNEAVGSIHKPIPDFIEHMDRVVAEMFCHAVVPRSLMQWQGTKDHEEGNQG